LVLTGQAGDGKTSIMYQVLSDFGVQIRNDINDFSITLKNGKTCRCIKDFSELFPGHGGMIDRIDSVMFVSPFAYFLLTMFL
jgi:predicted CDP-diglyceride synthetase/phosphatidate cytidylyltransferase